MRLNLTSWETHWPLEVDAQVARYILSLRGVWGFLFGRTAIRIAVRLHGVKALYSLSIQKRVREDLKALEAVGVVRRTSALGWKLTDLARILNARSRLSMFS